MFKKKKTQNEKSELQLLVPYEDFIEGQRAIALLEAVTINIEIFIPRIQSTFAHITMLHRFIH